MEWESQKRNQINEWEKVLKNEAQNLKAPFIPPPPAKFMSFHISTESQWVETIQVLWWSTEAS